MPNCGPISLKYKEFFLQNDRETYDLGGPHARLDGRERLVTWHALTLENEPSYSTYARMHTVLYQKYCSKNINYESN